MKFDVIIGNPPYQLNDGGGTGSSAIPIYHKFVEQAKKLNPSHLIMIIPSRWFSGGRGLDEFRNEMLKDKRLNIIHDFPNAADCFPGVEIKGGVCFFLWDRSYNGKCDIYTHNGTHVTSHSKRYLLEKDAETFIRYNEAIPILQKIRAFNEQSFSELISANDPFGFDIRVENSYKRIKPVFEKKPSKKSVSVYFNGWQKEGLGYIDFDKIAKNGDLVNTNKLLIPKAWGTGTMGKDWLNPIIAENGTCCTETYLVVGPFDKLSTTKNVLSFTQTKFFHFLVSLIKITQNAMKKVYSFVPVQDFSLVWSDKMLYKKYNLTIEEIDFIESMVRNTTEKDE